MRILVIEDERGIADFVERALQAQGHLVDTATDGIEGEHLALTHDVDLVVLTPNPARFRHQSQWVHNLSLEAIGMQVSSWADEDYGALWSRRLVLGTGLKWR